MVGAVRTGRIRRWACLFAVSGLLGSAALAADVSHSTPLDRLRQRSAADRWDELRSQYAPASASSRSEFQHVPSVPVSQTKGTAHTVESNQPTTHVAPAGSVQPAPLAAPAASQTQHRIEVHSQPSPTIIKPVPSPFHGLPPLPENANAANEMLTVPEPAFATPIHPDYITPPAPEAVTAQAENRLSPVPEEQDAQSMDTIFRPISRIEPYFDYSPTGKTPYEYLCPQPSSVPEDQRMSCPDFLKLPATGSTQRISPHIDYRWVASNLHHKPLYFEDVSLERYGHHFPEIIQPFVSVGKFGAQLIGLPYQMALDPVWRDQYALGYYRPGDPAPKLIYQVPLNLKAAAVAGGVYTGLFYLIP